MDGGAWWATVHGVAKSGTQLSDFTFTFYLYLSYSEHMDTQRLSGFLCQLPQLFSYIALPTFFFFYPDSFGASLVSQMVKHLPAMQETWVRSLGQEDPLEKKMATHSSTLAWRIPWTEELGGLQSMGSQRVGHD